MMKKHVKHLAPPATIGIVGGGQLGRMIAFEAKRLGFKIIVLDPKSNSPAGQVCDEQIVAAYSDLEALRLLAQKSDVLTFEFEHIDADLLSIIEHEGSTVYPTSATLKKIQNKHVQKNMLNRMGILVPEYCAVQTLEDLEKAFYQYDQKVILKTCTEGYDGKGNVIISALCDLEPAFEKFQNQEMIVEEYIDYIKEVSIIVAKNAVEMVFYPISENIHEDSILIKSLIPAILGEGIEEEIQGIAKKIVEGLDDFGVYCIEFFIDSKSRVLVNEIAPRPHNSGHYTIEGCVTSQFEQLVRIVCGMPLGSPQLRKPCVMYNLLGSQSITGPYAIEGLGSVLSIPDCYFHLYGKAESNHLKKIGHITLLDETLEGAEIKGQQAMEKIKVATICGGIEHGYA